MSELDNPPPVTIAIPATFEPWIFPTIWVIHSVCNSTNCIQCMRVVSGGHFSGWTLLPYPLAPSWIIVGPEPLVRFFAWWLRWAAWSFPRVQPMNWLTLLDSWMELWHKHPVAPREWQDLWMGDQHIHPAAVNMCCFGKEFAWFGCFVVPDFVHVSKGGRDR